MVASLYGPDEEQKSIWVYIEHQDGVFENVSLELLVKGRLLADEAGWRLGALLLGADLKELESIAYRYGADEAVIVEDPLLAAFCVDAFTHAACVAILHGKPSVFLCGATPNGRDLAGRLAVRLRAGLNADCTDLRLDKQRGVLTSEVTGFGGGVLALLEAPHHRPQMSTVRPGVFEVTPPIEERTGERVAVEVDFSQVNIRTRTVERVVGEGVDLTQAEILVCGGRGIDGDFSSMQALATLLGGEVGATRPPVDEGHIERERQVGQTGVVCRPKVALVCGISGAFHFIVGIQDAQVVVSINSDAKAPVFDFSDYCIVGDVAEVVPALIAALRAETEATHV